MLQAAFNHLKGISSQKDDQLEATRRVDHNWRRVEHNNAAQAARHSWSRLPPSLVGALGVTLPTDPGPNQEPTDHSLSLALANTASHFSTATILGNRRVLDDPLVNNIDLAQGHQDIVNEFTLNFQKALFRRLGPHIEKITICEQIGLGLWPVFTSAILYQQQLQRLEIFGQKGTRCLESLKALENFKFSPRLPSLQQLEVGGHEWWDEAELKYFTAFFNVIAPYLRVLTLNGIYPLLPGRYQPMLNLHSLDVNLETPLCVDEFLRPRGGLLKAVTLDKLQSFGLAFTYPSEDGSEDQLHKNLFTTIIGKMVNLQKLAFDVIISDALKRIPANKRIKKADTWRNEAKAALPNLTKLRVLHLKINAGMGEAGLTSITDYRYWMELFQVYVPGISKLVFHVPETLFHNCIQLDVNSKDGQWKKSLKSLVVNFPENSSLAIAGIYDVMVAILFFIPPKLNPASSLFSSLTTLTIINLPILSERILTNIADCCSALVEFNFSASGGDLYRSKKLQRYLTNPKSNPKYQQEVVTNFDATFASTIEKLKSLRVLRFIDDYDKLLPQTITAMCKRAMDIGGQQLKKKCLLRVPLTSEFNQEVLAMVEVKNLMDQAEAEVEIY